jgi:hypothetical protein
MNLSPISRSRNRALLCQIVSSLKLCSASSLQSPVLRPFALRTSEGDADAKAVRFTHHLPCRLGTATNDSSAVGRFHRHPYIGAPQTGVFIERRLSRIPPAFPRSLARCLSRARRHGALLLWLRHPPGYGFHLRRTLRKCRAWHLGAGHIHHPSTHRSRARGPRYSRRFAQECPEGNPGKYTQEKNNGALHQQRHFEGLHRQECR